eukprot:scaffold21.g2166.t1
MLYIKSAAQQQRDGFRDGTASSLVRWGLDPIALLCHKKLLGSVEHLRGSMIGVCVVAGHLPPLNQVVGDPRHGLRPRCPACGSGERVKPKEFEFDAAKLMPHPKGQLVMVSCKYICECCPEADKPVRNTQFNLVTPRYEAKLAEVDPLAARAFKALLPCSFYGLGVVSKETETLVLREWETQRSAKDIAAKLNETMAANRARLYEQAALALALAQRDGARPTPGASSGSAAGGAPAGQPQPAQPALDTFVQGDAIDAAAVLHELQEGLSQFPVITAKAVQVLVDAMMEAGRAADPVQQQQQQHATGGTGAPPPPPLLAAGGAAGPMQQQQQQQQLPAAGGTGVPPPLLAAGAAAGPMQQQQQQQQQQQSPAAGGTGAPPPLLAAGGAAGPVLPMPCCCCCCCCCTGPAAPPVASNGDSAPAPPVACCCCCCCTGAPPPLLAAGGAVGPVQQQQQQSHGTGGAGALSVLLAAAAAPLRSRKRQRPEGNPGGKNTSKKCRICLYFSDGAAPERGVFGPAVSKSHPDTFGVCPAAATASLYELSIGQQAFNLLLKQFDRACQTVRGQRQQ